MSEGAPIDISVIIPAKNEAKRLPLFLQALLPYCHKSAKNYEIIVVDDGSMDKTSEVVHRFQEQFSTLGLLRLKKNRGKGYAVRAGFRAAEGAVVLFIDADGSTPPEEIEDHFKDLEAGADIVIGSRVLKDDTHETQTLVYRRFIGMVFNTLVHLFLIPDIADTQCGFKMFRREAVGPVFSRLQTDGFGFDLEVLYVAEKLGFKIKEVPINWHHVAASKTNLFLDPLKMFGDIFRIRRRHRDLRPGQGGESWGEMARAEGSEGVKWLRRKS